MEKRESVGELVDSALQEDAWQRPKCVLGSAVWSMSFGVKETWVWSPTLTRYEIFVFASDAEIYSKRLVI